MSYSQNKEDLIVLEYFNGQVGTVLSIGENDGTTFSNARLLIEQGWKAVLVEPSSAFDKLVRLHEHNLDKVLCLPVAIGETLGSMTLYESGAHVPNGKDMALVSSLDINETEKWRKAGVVFKEREVTVIPFDALPKPQQYEFITIDVEGFDLQVLHQINLTGVGCNALCIEHNGDRNLIYKYQDYCKSHGMLERHRNNENSIFLR